MNREPVLSIATVTSVLTALFALLVAFGLPVDDDKQAAILGAAAVLVPIIAGLLARGKVTPVDDPRDAAGNVLTPEAGVSLLEFLVGLAVIGIVLLLLGVGVNVG